MKKILTIVVFALLLGACQTSTTRTSSESGAYDTDSRGPESKFVTLSPPVYSARQLALVIGNSQYEYRSLDNPVNDATDIAAKLRQMGFEVTLKLDLNQVKMGRAIRAFTTRLANNSGVGLFYFAGHGAQVDGVNYLLPIDNNKIGDKQDLKAHAVNVGVQVLERMELVNNHLNIIILDACRDDPYRGARGTRGGRGLARMQSAQGSLLAFATAPGKAAADSSVGGRNGIYTKYLLKGLDNALQTHQRLDDMLMEVRNGVVTESRGGQEPWYSASLQEPFCFGGCLTGSGGTTHAVAMPMPSPQPSIVLPPSDRDKDGIADNADSCANNQAAEIAHGVYQTGRRKGCPLDSDNDQVPNYRDACPHNQSPEISSGVDGRGCPRDTDRDGVFDYRDACPRNRSQETAQGVDGRGCPVDTDQDGVANYRDACPNTALGVKVNRQGCRPQVAKRAKPTQSIQRPSANSSYRYIDNGNGTVTDNWSGLIWLKNANCYGKHTWKNAKRLVSNLAPIQCDLRDGSSRGDWRLPTKEELEALIDMRYKNPALSNADVTGQWTEGNAFSGVQTYYYWSSTAYARYADDAWYVDLGGGGVYFDYKAYMDYYVWPVRGGV